MANKKASVDTVRTGIEAITTPGDLLYKGTTDLERLPKGTSGQTLKMGSGNAPEWGSAPAVYSSQQLFRTTFDTTEEPGIRNDTTTHTWTKPAGITRIRVFVTGAGGGGGYYFGGGGGGGGTAIKDMDVTSITSVTVTCGDGGYLVSSQPATDGGTSSFGSYCSATGGQGGGPHGHSNDAYPGNGGIGSGGDLNLPGGSGTGGMDPGGGNCGGTGGSTYWGGGIRGKHNSSQTLNREPASSDPHRRFGQGDGGYLASGGAGKAPGGIVVVYEYK